MNDTSERNVSGSSATEEVVLLGERTSTSRMRSVSLLVHPLLSKDVPSVIGPSYVADR